MKMQGKIKSIPVKDGHNKYVMTVGSNGRHPIEFKRGGQLAKENKLKTLVVKYEVAVYCAPNGDLTYETKQLPLKYSQWQSAIDNGLIDSDKEVEFFVSNHESDQCKLECSCNNPKSAELIIPQKKRMYSEEDMIEFAKQWRGANPAEVMQGIKYHLSNFKQTQP